MCRTSSASASCAYLAEVGTLTSDAIVLDHAGGIAGERVPPGADAPVLGLHPDSRCEAASQGGWMLCSRVPTSLQWMRARPARRVAAGIGVHLRLVALAIAVLLVSFAEAAQAQSSPSTRDPYSRIIARADAIVLGRVLEAGIREVPDSGSDGQVATQRGFARIAVQRWILGSDTDSTLDLTLSPYGGSLETLRRAASQSARSVILYLGHSRGEWWVVREIVRIPGRPTEGIEVLSAEEAVERVAGILQEAGASSPDSLAARADLGVVCSLSHFSENPPGMVCHVEQVIFGTLPDSVLTVVTRTPGDLRRGRAVLLLAARSDSTWELLDDGAGCYHLYRDRVAHSSAPLETVIGRMAAAHARRAGGLAR